MCAPLYNTPPLSASTRARLCVCGRARACVRCPRPRGEHGGVLLPGLHAIEFDNRILLIGESDKGLTLLDQGSLPEAVTDEAIVFARQQEAIEADDDGAVPRNLLIPRPENPPRNQTIARSNPARPAAARPTTQAKPQSKADVAIAKLNDFRTLLEKAGR